MKLRNIIMVSAFIATGFTACKKDYLDLSPQDTLSAATIFSTTKNASAAINGIHRLLYTQWHSNQATGGLSGNMLYMEVLGEDFVMTAQANGWFISEYRWLSHRVDNSSINFFNYAFFYAIIGNANQIIANIDGAVGTDAERNFIKGQAYAYRGWAYFQMIQLFGERYVKGGANSGLGLSLILEPRTTAVPRSTVEEVYTQINADLDQAISLLSGLSRPYKSHINEHVAKGFKARVALTQQNWADAAKYAAEARTSSYPLMDAVLYMDGFSDINTPEWLWGIRHQDDQPTYFYSYFAYNGNFSSTNTRGNPKAIFSPLYDRIKATDIRKKLWDPTGADATFPRPASGTRKPYMSRKFLLDNPANSNGDLAFMRASEMYLIEAEAQFRLNNETAAKAALFTLANKRDPSYTLSTNTGENLLEEILFQRRIELWGEGFRFYDLKRLNYSLNRNGGNHNGTLAQKLTEPAGTVNWQFLIPRSEIENTFGVVVQNPL